MVVMTRSMKRAHQRGATRGLAYGGMLASGLAGLYSSYRRGTTRQRRKRTTSGRGITHEDDRSRIYKKRRMPRRMRRRWRKQVRKFAYMDQYKLGTRSVVFNNSASYQEGTGGKQLLAHYALYGGQSTNAFLDDMQYIATTLEPASQPAGGTTAPAYLPGSGKIFFRSGVMDMTVRNTSYNSGTPNVISDVILEIDVYEIISGKRWVEKDTATGLKEYNSLIGTNELYDHTLHEMDDLAGLPLADMFSRGVTPWDNTFAISKYRLKILKKTKYRVGAGGTMTYQLRDPRQHTTSRQSLKEYAGCNIPGWTKHILIIAKQVPGSDLDGSVVQRIHVGCTRKYTYKVEGVNDDRTVYETR